MPDGKRKRRHCLNKAKRQWYARHRAERFRRRFSVCKPCGDEVQACLAR